MVEDVPRMGPSKRVGRLGAKAMHESREASRILLTVAGAHGKGAIRGLSTSEQLAQAALSARGVGNHLDAPVEHRPIRATLLPGLSQWPSPFVKEVGII